MTASGGVAAIQGRNTVGRKTALGHSLPCWHTQFGGLVWACKAGDVPNQGNGRLRQSNPGHHRLRRLSTRIGTEIPSSHRQQLLPPARARLRFVISEPWFLSGRRPGRAQRPLRLFWDRQPRAEAPLRVWYGAVSRSQWTGPADVKAEFGATVDFVGDNRLIFDIGGNKYRLIVHASYTYKRVLVKFVGTHAEYDRIDPETV